MRRLLIDEGPWLHGPPRGQLTMLSEAERHLERVICRAIQDAKRAGRKDWHQNEMAARTVRWMRPEISPTDALRAVESVRRKRLLIA